MTTMNRRPQNHMLTNIYTAAPINYGFSLGLVLHDQLLKQYDLEKVQLMQVSMDRYIS